MREMRDSGIEWIGKVPLSWSIIPVKYYFNIGRGRVISVLELEDDGQFPVYSSQTENNGCLGYINTYDYSGPSITWTTDGAKAGTVFYRDGKYNCTNVCGILTIKSDFTTQSSIKFMTYAIGMVAEQNKRKDINGYKIMSNEMANIRFAVPPLNEQIRIVNHLDYVCESINGITLYVQTELDRLEEIKQSIISEAVTQGLNRQVEMRESGIKWVSHLPAHWAIIPSKYLFRDSDVRKQAGDVQLTASQKYGIISQEEYMERENAKVVLANQGLDDWKHVEPYDFVISLRSFQGGLEMSETTGCITWHYVVLKATKPIYPKFYKWLFKSSMYITAIQRTCNFIRDGQDLRYSNFSQVPLYEPPLKEQKEIADYLDKKCADIDAIITSKQKQLETLDAYKKSIIFEYVTGKKEVG